MPYYPGIATIEPSVLWYGSRPVLRVYRGEAEIWPSVVAPTSVSFTRSIQANTPSGATYTLTASPKPVGTYRYDWDFGDGTRIDDGGGVVLHEFGHNQYYTVGLTASNDKGTVTTSLRFLTPAHPWAPVITYTRTRGEVVGDYVYYEGYFSVKAGAYPVEVKAPSVYEGTINAPITQSFAFKTTKGPGGGITGMTVTASNEYGSATQNLHYGWSQ